MSNSKYEYVKSYEIHTELLKNTYIVVRIDGKGFSKFTDEHQFLKPNDIRGIKLMNLAAMYVMNTFKDIFIAYGQSDEYSFAFRRDAKIYNRRNIVSTFTSAYIFFFNKIFDIQLQYPPSFDGRIILYPSFDNLKDYFSWRQVDCHINNLYNTTFWALVIDGKMTREQANSRLKGTFAKDKNEILFKEFMINYNNIKDIYKRGSILLKTFDTDSKNKLKLNSDDHIEFTNQNFEFLSLADSLLTKDDKYCEIIKFYYLQNIFISHEDLIIDEFWLKYILKEF